VVSGLALSAAAPFGEVSRARINAEIDDVLARMTTEGEDMLTNDDLSDIRKIARDEISAPAWLQTARRDTANSTSAKNLTQTVTFAASVEESDFASFAIAYATALDIYSNNAYVTTDGITASCSMSSTGRRDSAYSFSSLLANSIAAAKASAASAGGFANALQNAINSVLPGANVKVNSAGNVVVSNPDGSGQVEVSASCPVTSSESACNALSGCIYVSNVGCFARVYSTNHNDDGLSGGAIAGIVIGTVIGFFIIVGAVYYLVMKNPKHQDDKSVIYHDQETNQESVTNDAIVADKTVQI